VRNTGEVQVRPAGGGVVADVLVGGCVVVVVVVVGGRVVDVVVVGGRVVDVVVVVELVDVVVLVTGTVLVDVVGWVVGVGLSQVTLMTVRLTLVWPIPRPPQSTGVVVPTVSRIAPEGTAAAGAGISESRPDTADRARDAVQVRGCAVAAEAGTTSAPVRMSPFGRIRAPGAPAGGWRRARHPWIPALDTHTAPSAAAGAWGAVRPAAAAAEPSGAARRASAKADVMIEALDAGVTVATAERSSAVAVRYQADSRTPRCPLTTS